MMKRNILKRSLTVFLTAALLIILCLVPYAGASAFSPLDMKEDADVDKLNPDTGFRLVIYDGADILSASQIKQLAEDMSPVTDYCNVAFVSTDSNSYGDIMRYSENMYYALFGSSSGTMIIIDMDEREISVYSDGAAHKVITDAYGYDITDNIYRYASNGDYYSCASSGFDQIYRLLDGQKIARPMKYICCALMAILLSLLINFIIVNSASKIQNTSGAEMLEGASKKLGFSTPQVVQTGQTRTYSPQSSGSSGGGGHRSGGGGHHSGGGGHHGF